MKISNLIFVRRYYILAVILCVALLNLWLMQRKNTDPDGVSNEKPQFNSQKLKEYMGVFFGRNIKLRDIETRSSIYDEVFTEISFYDILSKYSLQDRCRIYFNHLSASNPDWMVNPHEDVSLNSGAFESYDTYLAEKLREAEDESKKAEEEGTSYQMPSKDEIKESFQKIHRKMLEDEQALHDYASHTRIFDKCFLLDQKENAAFVKKQQSFLKNSITYIKSAADKVSGKLIKDEIQCKDVEGNIFPWLTFQLPIFTRWNGKSTIFPGSPGYSPSAKSCFLKEYKSRLNGRGIVITIGNDHVDDTTRFIHLLRYLGNEYPIQVVYHSNLSKESRKNLVRAARDVFSDYPKQDLWFVDARPAINKKYLSKFEGFANKIVATMFNSFEEMFLCDADTVLLKKPSVFFEMKQFVQTRTFFFKDRGTQYTISASDIRFFQKLLPSVEDSAVFNVHQATNHTLENYFFQGFLHFMESGVVLVNRKLHFSQPLFMSLLTFYNLVTNRVHGDKELFWLALSIAGDELYAFNNNFAASIGDFTPDNERQQEINQVKSFRSYEICSNHPSHISDTDNHTLLWFNSGFRHCGQSFRSNLDWEREFSNKLRYSNLQTVDEYEAFSKSKVKILKAIIPPVFHDTLSKDNDEHEPATSWAHRDYYCSGYTWCAFSSVGGNYAKDEEIVDNSIEGTIVTFTADEIKEFEAAGDIWMADFEWRTEKS